tara:strand:+ start:579 stop:1025 length:447 start_codon:yes stop_codon:yes gene_type:complete
MVIDYENLKRKKILQTGGKSKYVWLMYKNIIKKTYRNDKPDQIKRFKTEVKLLDHLSNCPFVPKILHINQKNCTIYMTNVGKVLKEVPKDKRDLRQKMKELHLDWNLMRHRNGNPNYKMNANNGTRLNGKVYVIDFGSPHYKIVGPKI